jgi:hypothetical protein
MTLIDKGSHMLTDFMLASPQPRNYNSLNQEEEISEENYQYARNLEAISDIRSTGKSKLFIPG